MQQLRVPLEDNLKSLLGRDNFSQVNLTVTHRHSGRISSVLMPDVPSFLLLLPPLKKYKYQIQGQV